MKEQEQNPKSNPSASVVARLCSSRSLLTRTRQMLLGLRLVCDISP